MCYDIDNIFPSPPPDLNYQNDVDNDADVNVSNVTEITLNYSPKMFLMNAWQMLLFKQLWDHDGYKAFHDYQYNGIDDEVFLYLSAFNKVLLESNETDGIAMCFGLLLRNEILEICKWRRLRYEFKNGWKMVSNSKEGISKWESWRLRKRGNWREKKKKKKKDIEILMKKKIPSGNEFKIKGQKFR